MTHSVLIGAPNQTTGYELRSLVEELDDFTVIDVADSSSRAESLVAARDPEIVLLHADLGPSPVLQLIRDLVSRRPGTAVILLTEDLTPSVFASAMDAGARGALDYPASLEDLQTRLVAARNWVVHMRKHLSQEIVGNSENRLRGQLVVVAGAKGGVGTTTIATHLAHDAVTRVPGRSVCLVDLDLEKGDVANFLGIEHRLDISDLAKVADDLSAQTVTSAVHRDASGLSTLLSPARLEDVGSVGERETVLILAALRRQFDLVIADVGTHVSPVSAAAAETASQVLLVATPDVLALRGVHRTTEAWKRFGSRQPDDVKILLNKVSKENDIQPETAARLLPKAPLDVWLPDAFKVLERGLNHQSPAAVIGRAWWQRLHRLASELRTVTENDAPQTVEKPKTHYLRKRQPVKAVAEEGQSTIEFTAMIPLILLLTIILWQVGLWGVSAAYAGHAADEAARAASIGQTHDQIQTAALSAIPGWFRDGITVTEGPDSVHVRAQLPILVPGVSTDGLAFTTSVGFVSEN